MEPDEINPNPSSIHLPGPAAIDPLADPDAPRIPNFQEAVSALKEHPYPPQEPAQTLELLSQTADVINRADISNLQAARSSLSPTANFLPYVALLHASLAVVENDSSVVQSLLSDLRALIASTPTNFVPPAYPRWIGACRHAARLAIETHSTVRALSLIRPLCEAADKLAVDNDTLVAIHADYLSICLEAKCYKQAAKWIRERRRTIPQNLGLAATDVHLIFHYSALVMIGVKDYEHALQCCRLALSVPAPSPGSFLSVALSTYKVYIMLSLLVYGKSPPQLKFSSYSPSRLRKSSSEYTELAIVFEKMDRSSVQQVFESNKDLFNKQGNLGLVKQVINDFSRRHIIQVTSSYATMKISDLTRRTGLSSEEETKAILLNMIRDGKISASIDERTGMVSLSENDGLEETKIAAMMSSENMSRCLQIVRRVEVFRERLESDPAYIMKEISMQQGRRPSRGHGSHGAGPSSSPSDMDADYMSNGNGARDGRLQLRT